MDTKRKSYTPEFKLKVVLESMQRDTTQEEVCKKFGISSSMIHRWRKEFQANAASVFQDKRDPKQKAQSQGYEPGEAPDDLKKIIGELTVQNEILKKPHIESLNDELIRRKLEFLAQFSSRPRRLMVPHTMLSM